MRGEIQRVTVNIPHIVETQDNGDGTYTGWVPISSLPIITTITRGSIEQLLKDLVSLHSSTKPFPFEKTV